MALLESRCRLAGSEREMRLKLGSMDAKQVATELENLLPILDIPYELKDNGYGVEIPWDPANDWAQLGWLIEYVESKTDKRLIVESSTGRFHDCEKNKCNVDYPHRAMEFRELPDLAPTAEVGRLQIARLILGNLRTNEGVENAD